VTTPSSRITGHGIGLFGYGSLVLAESASMTLGRPVTGPIPANLHGWKRRFSQARHNLTCEKTFELESGRRPEWVLGLNVERGEDPAGPVNGAVIELGESELDRLDLREARYDRVEVTELVAGEGLPERIVTYTAKPGHFHPEPPEDAVILATYAEIVERAFELLGPGELDRYIATTGPYPVERVRAELVVDRIPEGNPRAW
jgi:cation transport regulator ChaC